MSNKSNVLLLAQSIDTPTGRVTAFFDNCSTCCLITHSAAQRLRLKGEAVTMEITHSVCVMWSLYIFRGLNFVYFVFSYVKERLALRWSVTKELPIFTPTMEMMANPTHIPDLLVY